MMLPSGLFAYLNLQLCYIIVSFQCGCSLAQPPSLMLATDIMNSIIEIECDITGFSAATIIFYENDHQVVEIRHKSGSCQQVPTKLPNHVVCSCKGNINAVCNVTIGSHKQLCSKWRCAVPKDGFLNYSNFIDVCNLNKTHFKTKIKDNGNCSDHKHYSVKWNILGMNIENNMIISMLKTYTAANISVFVNKYPSYQHARISTCSLGRLDSEDGTFSILDTSALCSDKSVMPVNKTCNAAGGNPLVTVIKEPNLSSQCQSIKMTPATDLLTLCDAVNRKDAGAHNFVGNLTVRASVNEFFVEGFNLQTFIEVNETTSVTFRCNGDGHPPPEMTFRQHGVEYSRGKSPIKQTITLNGSQVSGTYTCIASNALGKDSKDIKIICNSDRDLHQGGKEVTNTKGDKQSTVLVVGVVSSVAVGLIVFTLIMWLVKRSKMCVWLVEHFGHTCYFSENDIAGSEIAHAHASSTEIANAFDNETYSESINILEERRRKNQWSGPDRSPRFNALQHYSFEMETRKEVECSKHEPKYVVVLDALEDNPLYTSATQPGCSFSLAATASSSKHVPANIHNPHLRSEDITYSVVNKKGPGDTTFCVCNAPERLDGNTNTHSSTDDFAYSVVTKTKTHKDTNLILADNTYRPGDTHATDIQTKTTTDDYTYSVVKKKRRPDDTRIIIENKCNTQGNT